MKARRARQVRRRRPARVHSMRTPRAHAHRAHIVHTRPQAGGPCVRAHARIAAGARPDAPVPIPVPPVLARAAAADSRSGEHAAQGRGEAHHLEQACARLPSPRCAPAEPAPRVDPARPRVDPAAHPNPALEPDPALTRARPWILHPSTSGPRSLLTGTLPSRRVRSRAEAAALTLVRHPERLGASHHLLLLPHRRRRRRRRRGGGGPSAAGERGLASILPSLAPSLARAYLARLPRG